MLLELESLGVNPAQMAIEGYGEYAPFASNDTPEGRAENRKVVIALSKYALPIASESQNTNQENTQKTVIIEDSSTDAQNNNQIKVIELPNGGIRITTREEEKQ